MVKLKNCYLNEMESIFANKKVFAYGAGALLDIFAMRNPSICIEEYIYKMVDRNVQNKVVGNKEFNVISMKELRSSISKEDIILVTTNYYYADIIDELDMYTEFDGVETYILSFIESNFSKCEVDWDIYYRYRNEEQVIPKRIHYCWFGGGKIPPHLEKCMMSWERYCPDYEIVLWNEDNYDFKKSEYMYEAYKHKKWAYVSDYARIDIINKYGGVYLDTDVELVKPLDELLHFNGFMGYETNSIINTGLGFGCKGECELLYAILEEYNKMHFVKKNGELDLTPCTYVQSRVLKKFGFQEGNKIQALATGVIMLPTVFLGGMNWGTKKIELKESTYAIHHYNWSWLEEKKDILETKKRVSDRLLSRMEANK